MSFSQRCKKEILKKEAIDVDAELIALLHFIGSVRISNGQYNIVFKTYYNNEARYIYNLIKTKYNYSSTFEIQDINQFNKERLYTIIIEDGMISDQIIENEANNFINQDIDLDDITLSSIKSFLKVAFIFRGSVNDPKRGYNLEISSSFEKDSRLLRDFMNVFELNPKINKRNDNYIIYLKDSDKISDFLAILGANKSLFELEDVRAMKSIRNDINRQTNFDKANIDRTVRASLIQVDAINLLIKNNLFNFLSKDMKEVGLLRLKNPYTSIEELGEMIDPPMSKSKVNYRLQKFIKMAEDL